MKSVQEESEDATYCDTHFCVIRLSRPGSTDFVYSALAVPINQSMTGEEEATQ